MPIAFLPTVPILRAHPALARLCRAWPGRPRRLDAIFMSWPKLAWARELGWEELGTLVEVPAGRTTADTFAEVPRPMDVLVLAAGETSAFANCHRAAATLGRVSWTGFQSDPVDAGPPPEGALVADLRDELPDPARQPGTIDEFWEAVDRQRAFVWVLRFDAIGDVLLTLASLRAFKRRFPQRRIGLVARRVYLPWLERLDWIDRVVGVDVERQDVLEACVPRENGPTAWINLMWGSLNTAGNHLLARRSGPRLGWNPAGLWACDYSPPRDLVNQRAALSAVFGGLEPEPPVPLDAAGSRAGVWFSPFPGADERLWPPDRWAAALAPLRGVDLVVERPRSDLHERWLAAFEPLAAREGLRPRMGQALCSPLDLYGALSTCRAWVGINSAPMHVAGHLGLPALAIGMPWERNDVWLHPSVTLIDRSADVQEWFRNPTSRGFRRFLQITARDDGWADALYLSPSEFAEALDGHPAVP